MNWTIRILAMAATIAGTPAAWADVFQVDTSNDWVDDNPGDGVCSGGTGGCSLRAAIMEANALPGLDTIIVPAGVYTLTIGGQNEDAGATGDLDVTDPVEILGAGRLATIIDGNLIDRVFHVGTLGHSEISDLTVRNGRPAQFQIAGGIYEGGGTMTLTNVGIMNNRQTGFSCTSTDMIGCVITGNSTPFSVGGGTLSGSMTNCLVEGNSSTSGIGGVNVTGLVTNCVIRNNSTAGGTGGIAAAGSTLVDCTIEGNTSASGGGGLMHTGNVVTTLRRCTIRNNTTGREGGGIVGGNQGTLNIENCTVSGNTAKLDGGGLFMAIGNTVWTVTNTTITNNIADSDDNGSGDGGGVYRTPFNGTLNFRSCVIAGNVDRGGQAHNGTGPPNSALNSLGYNLVGNTTGFAFTGDLTGNMMDADPMLLPLADNGGATRTHALKAGSPAIDAGSPTDGPTEDQRGLPRPMDGDGNGSAVRDIGAYELEAIIDCDGEGTNDADQIAANPGLDANDSGILDTCEAFGDGNGDGRVDVSDLMNVLDAWGDCPAPPEPCLFDANGDGVVDVRDLLIVLMNWS